MAYGKLNNASGLLILAGFMAYGFILICLHDFAPRQEHWLAGYALVKPFEARLAPLPGTLRAAQPAARRRVDRRCHDLARHCRLAGKVAAGVYHRCLPLKTCLSHRGGS